MSLPALGAELVSFRTRPIWASYLLAVVSSTLVVLIKIGLDHLFGVEAAFLLLFSAVFLSALYGGTGPGLLAAVITVAAGDFFYLRLSFESGFSPHLLLRLSIYALECVGVIAMCASHHRDRDDNERLRYDLERKVEEFRATVNAQQKAEIALRAQEETQRFLAQAGEALASSLDYQTTLASVARLAVPHLADWCFVDVITEEGNLERVAASHADPVKRGIQEELQRRYPTRPNDPAGPASVARTGRSEWVTQIPEELIRASAYDEEHFQILQGFGLTSLLCVPLIARDRTVGVITLISAESGRHYGAEDVALAEDLAHRAALAVDNAWLYRAAQAEIRAREQIQRDLEQNVEVRREAEEALRRHQTEIEALNQRLRRAMTETHHRVKNNLQVISAMIDLQTMDGTETLPTSEFTRLSLHVRMLATVHDLLTEQAKRDNAANTLSAQQLLQKFLPLVQQMAYQKRLSFVIEDATLTSDQGTSLALIANEIYSNAIKHGHSEVNIHFYVEGGTAVLEVSDDGPGFPANFDPERAANTGLDLVLNLTSLDLRGTIRFDNRPEGGGRVHVAFPIPSQARVTPSF